jgi:Uri superfamily endonuclease
LFSLPDKKGSYVLILRNNAVQTIRVGRLGGLNFQKGFYAYAGSAMGGLSKRVTRYLKEIRKPFWHIDAIMPRFKLMNLWLFPSDTRQECQIARLLSQAPGAASIKGFGSSDCPCFTHLFYFTDLKQTSLFLKIKETLDCKEAIEISSKHVLQGKTTKQTK